ncbi:S8 family peptidase [Acidovorax sp. CCYZU-2555]|uniref:S8 family peptidase n=1 Tax=Acidovorax sp. CCYZU-2555 TaxID=2835042 RepID=UPI001BCEB7A5|nr:S8 family peptidase [Acidovorax sp. CCYZU-2555]MBS7776802.1 S8 family peptidase [Acidovorax sp. CCYZU-2555]
MRDYPVVRVSREPAKLERLPAKRRPIFPKKLPYSVQLERLGRTFEAATQSLVDFTQNAKIAADPRAVIPERALVLEIIGPVDKFDQAVQALGLEWLGSMYPNSSETVNEQDEDDESDSEDESVPSAKLFYLTMPSEKGLRTLLAAWNRFTSNKAASTSEETRLWNIFGYLSDFRTWSVKDRIDPSLAKYVVSLLQSRPDEMVTVEVDLWYRSERERRDQALGKLRALANEFDGDFADFIEIPEIHYQGVLLRIPGSVALQMINGEGGLARLDDIMRVRPQSAFDGAEMGALLNAPSLTKTSLPNTNTQCFAAILDGYPVTQHEALKDRIVVHEVDVTAAQVPVAERRHGTAMASLIVHGDLSTSSEPLDSRVAIIPVLTGGAQNEGMPRGLLAIGVIYRALKSLVNERGQNTSPLSRVVIVNHSICDTYAPFVRMSSPWASLIDYYSHHHQMLFVVSAGNIKAPIPVIGVGNPQELLDMSPQDRDALLINSFRESSGTRGLLCPAETINSLSVGALHNDGGGLGPITEIDPFQGLEMISLGSALGLGLNRSVKPELTANGGRAALGVSVDSLGKVQVHSSPSKSMGHRVARPGLAGESDRYGLSMGTSDAAALTTRSAVQIASILENVFQKDNERWSERPTRAAILKAMLVHSARWGRVGKMFFDLIKDPNDHHRRASEKNQTTRFVGFGKPDPDFVMNGDQNRITLIADDLIKGNERHIYKLPIPKHMLRTRDLRSITFTLAWTTPILVSSVDYRAITLKLVDARGEQKFWKGVKRGFVQDQPVQTTMERGTVAHLQLTGKTLWQYGRASDAQLEIAVQAICKHESNKNVSAPYALAITMEVAQSINTSVYAEIRDHVQARQQQRTRNSARRN